VVSVSATFVQLSISLDDIYSLSPTIYCIRILLSTYSFQGIFAVCVYIVFLQNIGGSFLSQIPSRTPSVSRSTLSAILFPFSPFSCIHQSTSLYPARVSVLSKIARRSFLLLSIKHYVFLYHYTFLQSLYISCLH
jgi:amino acid permease